MVCGRFCGFLARVFLSRLAKLSLTLRLAACTEGA